MSDSMRELLAGMVGPEALVPEGEADRWLSGSNEGGPPTIVLAPSTDQELARVLSRASEEGWRVLPAGFGSWMEGGGAPRVSLVVTTKRMQQISEYEPADLTFTAGAGISLSGLREITEPHGQWLPLDPPGGGAGSLGAAVALGTGGPLRHLYGTPRDHVLGLTLVSGDGRVLRWGGRVVKNVAGFDLTRLCIGSWGSLGVLTSISARLFPIPDTDVTLCIRGPDLFTLLPLAQAMAQSTLSLAAVELMNPLGPTAHGFMASDGSPDGPTLVLRLLGSRDQVAEMESRVLSGLSEDRWIVQRLDGKESQALHGHLSRWEEGMELVARLCLLPSEMGFLLEEARELDALASNGSVGHQGSKAGQLRFSAHVGAGVARLAVKELPRGEEQIGIWASALQSLRNRLEERGGSLTLSVGPPALMRKVGAWGGVGGERVLMEGLKEEFDPNRILAPGRLGL